MFEVTQPDSSWSMKLHDALSFEAAQCIMDVLRVARGWVYTWRGTNTDVLVPWNRFTDRAEGTERYIR
jgi:hypothetical protein